MTKDDFSLLLKEANLVKLELMLNNPNIFSILRIEKNEIRHSNFLAWLLNPKQGHNIGDRFLKWFLKDVFSDSKITWIDEFKVDSLRFDDINIYREYYNIDLLLVTEKFVIVIENKVLSGEHSDQLKKYRETVDKIFPDKKHIFIFLTLIGEEPIKSEDNDVYVNYSYYNIASILDLILDVYKSSLPDNAFYYISDYLSIIKREIMQDDELVRISQEIYKNHKDAIDFILENKPDRLLSIMPIAVEAIRECGYVPGSQNKGYARFLTTEINDIIPRNSIGGWKNQELFLFEISMWSKNIVLKTVIAPGNDKQRNIIKEALLKIPDSRDAKTKLWNTIHSKKKSMNFQEEKYEDLELVKKDIIMFLTEQQGFIKQVSEEIELVKNELIT